MVALWIEPGLVSSNIRDVQDSLSGEIIVDYSGTPGTQRYVYFPSEALQGESQVLLDRLYSLHLLCRATVVLGKDLVERFFVPIVTPAVLESRFDEGLAERQSAHRLWRAIRRELDAKVRRVVESGGVRR